MFDETTKLPYYVKLPRLDPHTVHLGYSCFCDNPVIKGNCRGEVRRPIEQCHVKRLNCNWIQGRSIFGPDNAPLPEYRKVVKSYGLVQEKESFLYTDEGDKVNAMSNIKSEDSLSHYPGCLELNFKKMKIPLIFDAFNYDLTSFKAKVIKKSEPFAFNAKF